MSESQALTVRGLKTSFRTSRGSLRAVDDVSFSVPKGKTLCIVGESGSGKSVTALSILRLIPEPPGKIEAGEIVYGGKDLLKLPIQDMRRIRGKEISMVFQEPMTCLNPVFTIGNQIREAIALHQKTLSRAQVREKAIEMLKVVGIPAPESRIDDYPHQLSGGMRQRVMIAMALSCDPQVLIADEPTTALDVTIQAQVLELLKGLQKSRGLGLILITHDLGIVAEIADEVAVMYGGQIVEQGTVEEIFMHPTHPYTRGLLQSIPKLGKRSRLEAIPGIVPDLLALPSGCRFQERCAFVKDECKTTPPPLRPSSQHPTQLTRCLFDLDLKKGLDL